jgi:hypothetical protein
VQPEYNAQAGDRKTLRQAQEYADAGDSETLSAANQHAASQIAGLRNEAFAGVAQSAALVVLTPDPGGSTFNIGAANYNGQNAIGVTFAHRHGSTIFSGGAAASNSGRGLVRLSMGWSF